MAAKVIYWTADGGGAAGGTRARELHKWIVQQKNADLIVFGGDVYHTGSTEEFDDFLAQMDHDVSLMCETAGNHDWDGARRRPGIGLIPRGYEQFWSAHASQQPIDTSKNSGARYEHFRDVNGWRLVFLDTGQCGGRCDSDAWPFSEQTQSVWLQNALAEPNRAKIVFSHHSRLSWGSHGDNPGLQKLWELFFDSTGTPLVAVTLSGHDHNVSVYKPRDRGLNVTADEQAGVQIIVNGAGGAGHYPRTRGTRAEIYPRSSHPSDDKTTYCVTRITIDDTAAAELVILGFGHNPSSGTGPEGVLFQQRYTA